jgi:uncharacterized protein YjbI with pentapeptide repeats
MRLDAGTPGATLDNLDIVTRIALSQANFEGADLTAANFTRANLASANFKGARIDAATSFLRVGLGSVIWFDGRVCVAGAIGERVE